MNAHLLVRALAALSAGLLLASALPAAAVELPIRTLPREAIRSESAAVAPSLERAVPLLRERVATLAGAPAALVVRERADRGARAVAMPSGTVLRSAGTPRQLPLASLGLEPLRAVMGGESDLAVARETLRRTAHLLGIDDPDVELRHEATLRDELGQTHLRFEQRFRGIPVWPANLIVHLDETGAPHLIDGAFTRTPRKVVTEPLFGAEHARRRAVAVATPRIAIAGEPQLVIYAAGSRPARLAWRIEVTASSSARWIVVIDALNGRELTRYSMIRTANVSGSGVDLLGVSRPLAVWQGSGGYYLIDTTKNMYDPSSTPPKLDATRGAIFVLDARNAPDSGSVPIYYATSTTPTSWEPNAVSAAWGLSQTYDYFLERHNRKSYDGNGISIQAIVRWDQNLYNAFWDSTYIRFGTADRFVASLDVVAHELTHAVTEKSADLVYKDQPGALNEAMSDIFGEMVEARAAGSNDWILGSQLSEKMRSMIQPELYGQPSKMSAFMKMTEDNGGVHYNSGIINRAYYLLAAGMPGAIGLRDAERIFYRALTTHLTANSDFLDMRLAAIESARELFGSSSTQATRTAEAFDAVEIFEATPPPPPPSIPPVVAADSTLFLYVDGGQTFLGRHEAAQGDPVQGVALVPAAVSANRPSVSGDGSLAFFVDGQNDACFVATLGNEAHECLGFPGRIASVAMSPDGVLFSFVFLDQAGERTNSISVIDIERDTTATFEIEAPVFDGASISSVQFADSMDITADGGWLIYDAFNVSTFFDGSQIGTWSIYALELTTGDVLPLVGPVYDADITFPSLSNTSDRYLTFDVQSETASWIYATDLDTAAFDYVERDNGYMGIAGYSGDDSALVFTYEDETASGYSLVRVPMLADRISFTPDATFWMKDAYFGVVYRRGAYQGPTTKPGTLQFSSSSWSGNEGATVTISVTRVGGVSGAVSVPFSTSGSSAASGVDFQPASGTLSWADGDSSPKTFGVRLLADAGAEGNETFSVRLGNPAGGATLAPPSTATVTIRNVEAPATKRKRGARRP